MSKLNSIKMHKLDFEQVYTAVTISLTKASRRDPIPFKHSNLYSLRATIQVRAKPFPA